MTADELIAELSHCQQKVVAWLAGLSVRSFRDRHAPRNAGGSYDARSVVAHFVESAESESMETLAGVDTDEMRRWRRARAGMAEIELAERMGELVSTSEMNERVSAFCQILRSWAQRIAPDNPAIARTYHAAIRDGLTETERRIRPPKCRTSILIHPPGAEPFELGPFGPWREYQLPSDTRPESRRCPRCNGELYGSWGVNRETGEETPIWACHTINCTSQTYVNGGHIPRLTGKGVDDVEDDSD